MISVINLPYRTDRRREMEAQLRRVGWHADFFPAFRPADRGDFPSVGAKGCFLSHLSILKMARDSNEGHLIILEDDLNFSKDFSEAWKSVAEFLRSDDWDIFYPANDISSSQRITRISPKQEIRLTHFVVFHRRAILLCISEMEAILSRRPGDALGGPMHVDGAYSTIRLMNPDLRTFAHYPPLGYQRPSRTDIGATHALDKFNFLRPIMAVARKVKAALR